MATTTVEQGGIADSVGAAGAATAPGAGATIAATAALPAGTYAVQVTTLTTGTAEAVAGMANMQLRHGTVSTGSLPSVPVVITAARERVTVAAGETINVIAIAAGGAGVNYVASITATRIA